LGLGCRTLIGGDKQNPLSSRTVRGHGSSLSVERPDDALADQVPGRKSGAGEREQCYAVPDTGRAECLTGLDGVKYSPASLVSPRARQFAQKAAFVGWTHANKRFKIASDDSDDD